MASLLSTSAFGISISLRYPNRQGIARYPAIPEKHSAIGYRDTHKRKRRKSRWAARVLRKCQPNVDSESVGCPNLICCDYTCNAGRTEYSPKRRVVAFQAPSKGPLLETLLLRPLSPPSKSPCKIPSKNLSGNLLQDYKKTFEIPSKNPSEKSVFA